jgi:hypothetical protein
MTGNVETRIRKAKVKNLKKRDETSKNCGEDIKIWDEGSKSCRIYEISSIDS